MLEPPPSFLCPITLAVFADPVVLVATGQSFERVAIQKHLQHFNTCPATLLRLHDKTFVANHQLRKVCVQMKNRRKIIDDFLRCSTGHPGVPGDAAAHGQDPICA
jgi:SUMO ligase MMS21 Smc5/6 complex component